MNLHGKSILAGQPGSGGGQTFRAVNPATNTALEPDFHEASAAEVERTVRLAEEAFAAYRTVPGAERARLLENIATELEGLGDSLLQRAHAETGLPIARITGERARTCGQLRLFAQLAREGSWVDARIDPALPDRQPLPRPDVRRMLIPLGPVVVFGSSNFPLAFSVAGGDTASALAAGCTVLVKAHRAHPGTSEMVGAAITRAVQACGLPPGVFSLVHGNGSTVGIAMVKHPATTAVGFTGSHAAGRALHDAAAARSHPIPVFAEMSSLNPVFLLPHALQERGATIAQGLTGSFTLGVGQFCTKPGLVFALRSPQLDAFIAKLTEVVAAVPAGTMLTRGIREAFFDHRKRVVSGPGVVPLVTAAAAAPEASTGASASVARTTAANFLQHPELAIEAFGPFMLLIVAESVAEISACVAALDGQLTATVHGTAADLSAARGLVAALERKVGRIVVNGFPTGVEVCPAMHHGGPSPATSDARFTSVGTAAIYRWARPVCYQGFADELLPPSLQNANPLGLTRLVDGKPSRDAVAA